ncbi:MAG TPA: tripartite tricarboxylate transporter substrate binding protein [Reyranella sp.]|jgi:tripartite-type tricarboxylate transporter receptor subunit TctC|nr:tripartite tricarboxylate transporter substrate binding protein [Reyranella sp.]
MMYRRSLLASALGAVPLSRSWGQQYPTRPVRVVVGFPPGGGTDLVARQFTPAVQSSLGQSFVIDNRAGANGSVGLEAVAKSPPDGYTLGHVNSSVVVTNPLLYKNMTINVERDLAPVCTVADSPVAVVVPADLPVKDLRDLVALSKSQPGLLHFGSGGMGSVDHMSFEVIRQQTGLADVMHVPYRGGGPALNDMLGGRVQLMVSAYGMYKGQVDAGRIRVIALLGTRRHPALPDVPTGIEQGFPKLVVVSWQAIVAPAHTSDAIIDRLEGVYRKALDDANIARLYAELGYFPTFRGRQEMAALLREETAQWGAIIKEQNIQVD